MSDDDEESQTDVLLQNLLAKARAAQNKSSSFTLRYSPPADHQLPTPNVHFEALESFSDPEQSQTKPFSDGMAVDGEDMGTVLVEATPSQSSSLEPPPPAQRPRRSPTPDSMYGDYDDDDIPQAQVEEDLSIYPRAGPLSPSLSPKPPTQDSISLSGGFNNDFDQTQSTNVLDSNSQSLSTKYHGLAANNQKPWRRQLVHNRSQSEDEDGYVPTQIITPLQSPVNSRRINRASAQLSGSENDIIPTQIITPLQSPVVTRTFDRRPIQMDEDDEPVPTQIITPLQSPVVSRVNDRRPSHLSEDEELIPTQIITPFEAHAEHPSSVPAPARVSRLSDNEDLSAHTQSISLEDESEEDIPLANTIQLGNPRGAGAARIDSHGVGTSHAQTDSNGNDIGDAMAVDSDSAIGTLSDKKLEKKRNVSNERLDPSSSKKRKLITYDKSRTNAVAGPSRQRPQRPKADISNDSSSDQDDDDNYAEWRAPPKRGRSKRPLDGPSAKAMKPTATVKNEPNSRSNGTGTRVFAYWLKTKIWFPGIVADIHGENVFLVEFDDGNEQSTEVEFMRSCQLASGDDVYVKTGTSIVQGKVVNAKGEQPDSDVVVQTKEQVFAKIRDISVLPAAITSAWDNRKLNPSMITARTRRRQALASTVKRIRDSCRRSDKTEAITDLLKGMGFAVTVASTDGGGSCERDEVTDTISRNGGHVFDELSEVLNYESEIKRQRWRLTRKGYIRKEGINQLLLLAEGPNLKAKYLIALALGIPCLSFDWLNDVLENSPSEVKWTSYLLPAGYSPHAGASVSQRLDLNFGKEPRDDYDRIATSRVAPRLFEGKDILIVDKGAKLPSVKGKRNEDQTSIPTIVIALGAESAEIVKKIEDRFEEQLQKYDYIITKDVAELSRLKDVPKSRVLKWDLVKESIILGRLIERK